MLLRSLLPLLLLLRPSLPFAPAAALRAEASALEASFAADRALSIQAAFSRLDKDADGVVSLGELSDALAKEGFTDPKAVARLFGELDRDGSGGIDASELTVTIPEMGTRVEAYVREERAARREAEIQLKEEKEKAARLEERMQLINDAPPSTSDKLLSVLPYLFPLLDGLQYGRFVLQGSDNPALNVVALLYVLYRSVPFSGFAAFFALNLLSGNTSINRLVRYNMQQAIFVDIALILPGLLFGVAQVLSQSAGGIAIPQAASEVLYDGVFFTLLATLLYCTGSSLLGKEPSALPIIGAAVKERMPSADNFDEEGRFVPRQREERKGFFGSLFDKEEDVKTPDDEDDK
ncbi:hypothetical protein TeGR_g11052 [Tetraparma gracilis]|uniref:EF-hand domain-containing protein n=1 Tax=Tetraparma gracilis TaxID=2962635 RepID=A0ABQ6MNN5_9STRA|nr:hypothetical protein TeGR_g11052 [Tetraparma gracilis]